MSDDAANALAPYGYCPICGQPGVRRERRPGGNDTCAVGHLYLSANALIAPPGRPSVLKDRIERIEAVIDAIFTLQGPDDVSPTRRLEAENTLLAWKKRLK